MKLQSLCTVSIALCIFLQAGCSKLNEQQATMIADLAKSLGADVSVRGILGPARFGPSFQADLGARLDIEASTDTGAVSAKDLLDLNKQILEMIEHVLQVPCTDGPAVNSAQVIDETISDITGAVSRRP